MCILLKKPVVEQEQEAKGWESVSNNNEQSKQKSPAAMGKGTTAFPVSFARGVSEEQQPNKNSTDNPKEKKKGCRE